MEAMDELKRWLAPHGLDDTAKLDENDPRKPIVDAARYLRNNRGRMDYPHYRRLGLPVTSALMESLVKEVNYRVKGTEMFWNDPERAEAILQVRAATLYDERPSRALPSHSAGVCLCPPLHRHLGRLSRGRKLLCTPFAEGGVRGDRVYIAVGPKARLCRADIVCTWLDQSALAHWKA